MVKCKIYLIALMLVVMAVPGLGANISTQIREGVYQEEVEGDLDAAIKIFEGILAKHAENKRYAAQAAYRLGLCYLKKGQKDKAIEQFEQIVKDYPSEKLTLQKAESQLKKLKPKEIASANKPMVIDSFPKTYSTDVSADVKKLSVTFDQPMIKGNYSWVKWNWRFPETAGKPYYDETATTCSLPVKLEPGTAYLIRINAKQYSSFMNLDGVRAQPFVLVFATKGKDGKPTPIPDDMLKFAKYINGKQIQSSQGANTNALGVLNNFLKAIIAGDNTVAMKYVKPGSAVANQLDEFNEDPAYLEKVRISSVYSDDKIAFALTNGISSGSGKNYLTTFTLVKQRGLWMVNDIDMETVEKGKADLEEFLAKHPNARLVTISDTIGRTNKVNLFAKIDNQVTRFIGEKFGESAAEAGKKHLAVNSQIYYVDKEGDLYNGGINAYYNFSGRTIKGKISLGGTSYPNQTYYGIDGQELNSEIFADKRRSNHWQVYLIPDEPLAPGESLYYGWSMNDTAKLAKSNDDHFLQMQNLYGSSVIETFFLVLPKDMHISKSSKPTDSEELLKFNVYWWTKTVKQGENHVEKVHIAQGSFKYAFGPVIEKTVNDDGEKVDFMLDLDTGKLYSVSDAEKWSKDNEVLERLTEGSYIKHIGVDLMGETAQNSLIGFDLIAIPVNQPWDGITPLSIISRLSTGKPGTPVTLSADGKLPKTFVFKTGQGAMGVLQIVAMQANKSPRHFKIRYKLLEKSSTNKATAAKLAAEGWKLWGQRKLAEAEGKFKEATKLDPNNENAWQGLGWSQLNQGKRHNAKNSFKKCIEINAKNSAALNGLGWLAHGQGKTDEAIQWWEKAVEAYPGATASLSGLAQVYMEKQEYSKAILYYNMWLKVEPNNKQAKDGLKKAQEQQQKVGAKTSYKEFSDEHIAKVVKNAVTMISTCAEGDPKIATALKSLKQIKPELVLEELVGHMDSKAATKRRSAIYIAWRGEFEDITPAVKKLTELCKHESFMTRGMAALALGEKKVASSFDVLTNMTLNDENGYARRCAAYALGRLGNVKALETLKKATEDSDPMVKQNAEAAITMLTELKEK